jgi:hypothetical protein
MEESTGLQLIPSNTIATIFLLAGISGMVVANLVRYAMIGHVNVRVPEKERFAYIGFYWPKNQRVALEYRKLHPKGRLLWWYRGCVALALVCLVIAAYNDR